MQRQLYLVLFVIAAASAVVVVMRPNVAEELTTLGRLGLPGLLGQAVAAPPVSAEAAGESFISDSRPSSQLPNGYIPAHTPPGYPRAPSRPASAQSGAFGQRIAGQGPFDSRGLPPSPTRYQQPAGAPRFDSLTARGRYEPAAATRQYAEAGADRTRDRLRHAMVAGSSAGESFSTYPPRETYPLPNRPFSTYPSTPNAPGMANEVSELDRSSAAIPMPTRAGSPLGHQNSTGSFARSMAARPFDGAEVEEAPKSSPSKNWWDIDEIRAAEESRRRTAANATARRDRVSKEHLPPRDPSRTVSAGPAPSWPPSQQPPPAQFSGQARQPTPRAAAPPTPRIGAEISGARFQRARHVGNVPHGQYPTVIDSPTLSSAGPAATGPTRPPVASRLERPWQPPAGEMPNVAPDPPPTALCENAQTLARVGSHVILACEVLPVVEQVMEENKDKYPASVLEEQRELLIAKLLDQRIEMKLIFCDAQRSLPPEAITNIKKHLSEQFEEEEIPKRLEKAELGSRRELQEELEKIGSSLEREKRSFIERAVSQQWLFQQIGDDKEITHEEILDYYRQHAADFEQVARARWDQLTVRFSRHPDRREARALIAQMGNNVMRGRSFADVAREHSEGSTAKDGGVRDWTTKGSLRSERLDRTLFGLPVGELSPILEDEQGFHIVRVVERDDVKRTPFIEAQVEIKGKLRQAHRKEQMNAFTERLKEEIPVWTVFDDEVADRRSSESSPPPLR